MSVIWSYCHSYLNYQIQFSSDMYIDVSKLVLWPNHVLLWFHVLKFIYYHFMFMRPLYLVMHFDICPFSCSCIYLSCFVLYVLTHICFFPLQAQTIVFLIHLVARVSSYRFSGESSLVLGCWYYFRFMLYFLFESCGELWVCLMPPHREAC